MALRTMVRIKTFYEIPRKSKESKTNQKQLLHVL